MQKDFIKLSRLYVENDLASQSIIDLEETQTHYLRNVMRRNEGDFVRIFNGRDGEWLCAIIKMGKKQILVRIEDQIRQQTDQSEDENNAAASMHLIFAPIKKERLGFLIEKAVELGCTAFHPVITNNTQNAKINTERTKKHIIEAAEQCERLTVPDLHKIASLDKVLGDWPEHTQIFAAIERMETGNLPEIAPLPNKKALLVGPEGGFTSEEIAKLQARNFITPFYLGQNILRAETAVCAGLALLTLQK